MIKFIWGIRDIFGYRLTVYLTGSMKTDENTIEQRDFMQKLYPSWPITFIDHSDKIKIEYP